MGLLDEAIRDHLELKRRRGADPGEVAREQREVLDVADQALPTDGASGEPGTPSVTAERDPLVSGFGGEQGILDRETAELDMSTVLADDTEAQPSVADDDSLTWEVPDRRGEPPADEGSSRAGLE